jgi:hypothetical protein
MPADSYTISTRQAEPGKVDMLATATTTKRQEKSDLSRRKST